MLGAARVWNDDQEARHAPQHCPCRFTSGLLRALLVESDADMSGRAMSRAGSRWWIRDDHSTMTERGT